MPLPVYNRIAGQRLNRVEALSDGVFAIAMTLLVLELRIPVNDAIRSEADVWRIFVHLKAELLTYFLSFMTLGIFWVGQSVQFQYIVKSDRNLFWINILFLMLVSLLPFTTSFLARYIEYKAAIIVYWINILLLGIFIYINWIYVMKHNYAATEAGSIEAIDKALRKRVIVAQSLYAVGMLLCFISTYASIIFIILVQLNYAFAIVGSGRAKKTPGK
ncbi:MAG: TMEM175 family protein [Chitinophagaceae bacterium]